MATDSPRFDHQKPDVARTYAYLAGEKDYFPSDEQAATEIIRMFPGAKEIAYHNRAFLRRAIRHVVKMEEVSQIIDIGCGLPEKANTHDIALEINDTARVAYVDNSPVVVNHAIARMSKPPQVIAINGDLTEPHQILSNAQLRACIDFQKPIAVIFGSVLHFVPSLRAFAAVEEIKELMPDGSYLIISHVTSDDTPPEQMPLADIVGEIYSKRMETPVYPRSLTEITSFFDGLDLYGDVADVRTWPNLPDKKEESTQTILYGGVGWKDS